MNQIFGCGVNFIVELQTRAPGLGVEEIKVNSCFNG
jgi:hypothetical protein